LKKILEHSSPPGYRQQKPRPKKKLGAFLERIRQILKDDPATPEAVAHIGLIECCELFCHRKNCRTGIARFLPV
jgi:hypothetical protein